MGRRRRGGARGRSTRGRATRRTRGGSAVPRGRRLGPRPTRILVARRPGSRPGRAPRGARGQTRWGSCSRRTSGSARSPRASWDDAPRPSGRGTPRDGGVCSAGVREAASRPRGGKRRGGGVKTPRDDAIVSAEVASTSARVDAPGPPPRSTRAAPRNGPTRRGVKRLPSEGPTRENVDSRDRMRSARRHAAHLSHTYCTIVPTLHRRREARASLVAALLRT